MRHPGNVTLFTKSACDHCARAKSILKDHGIDFAEINIDQSATARDICTYYSGSATVPQIFFGDYHVNGADDLAMLAEANRLKAIVEKTSGAEPLSVDNAGNAMIEAGQDFSLSTPLGMADPSRDYSEDNLVLLHAYRDLFGFIPKTWRHISIWPEAFKLTALTQVLGSMAVTRMAVGMETTLAMAYATSKAHGCTYCQTHTARVGGDNAVETTAELLRAKNGEGAPDGPFGHFEVALTELAEQAALNTVSDDTVQSVRSLASEARGEPRDPDAAIMAAGLISSMMGYLNVVNDTINVDIEGGFLRDVKSSLDLDAGRHGATDENPTDLQHEIPAPQLDVPTLIHRYIQAVGDVQDFATREFGYLPNWLAAWPAPVRSQVAYALAELLTDKDHAKVPAELKHLILRVSHIARGFPNLAAAAALSAYHVGPKTQTAIERIKTAYDTAVGRAPATGIFSDAEAAALRLAWLSAQIPVITPKRFMDPLIAEYSSRELAELINTCGIAGAIQRMSAIMKPDMDAEAQAFCTENAIETGLLKLRYSACA